MEKIKRCVFWEECRTGLWCVMLCEDLELVIMGGRVISLHVCDLLVC